MDTAAPESLIGHFSKLVDWESRGTKRHESIDVIVLCVMKRRRGPMRATGTRALQDAPWCADERWSTDSVSAVFEPGGRLLRRSSGQAGRPAPLGSAGTQVGERPSMH